jgi:predicted 2-oxoglutarate/Fe(II)-dependent dioxygenase YbiX
MRYPGAVTRFPELNERLLFTIDQALSPSACAALIAELARAEPPRVRATRPGGLERRNDRLIRVDPELAQQVFERVRAFVPQQLIGMRLVGANECLRYYRYGPGDYFLPHQDTHFSRDRHERSLLSLMIYLNEGYEGGEIAFPEHGECIRPTTGLAVAFGHRMLHESRRLETGTKYAFRSDLMYRSLEA